MSTHGFVGKISREWKYKRDHTRVLPEKKKFHQRLSNVKLIKLMHGKYRFRIPRCTYYIERTEYSLIERLYKLSTIFDEGTIRRHFRGTWRDSRCERGTRAGNLSTSRTSKSRDKSLYMIGHRALGNDCFKSAVMKSYRDFFASVIYVYIKSTLYIKYTKYFLFFLH